MSTIADPTTHARPQGWFSKSEAWLDDKGKGAWIAAMVLGFVFFWPIGLALLMYMIWSKRMFAKSCSSRKSHHSHHAARMGHRHGFRSTGNTAFDSYKADTLQRLMDEQQQFEAFLDRLRDAKDKQEFDQFMDERADVARNGYDTEDDIDNADDAPVIAKEPKK